MRCGRITAALSLLIAGCDAAEPYAEIGRPPKHPTENFSDSTVSVTVTFRVRAPIATPDEPPVSVVGDFQGWEPRQASLQLRRERVDRWEAQASLPAGRTSYKYLRGSWLGVEKGPLGEDVGDRVVDLQEGTVIEDEVASFANHPLGPSTATGDIRLLDALDRPVWVYLPPGYENDPTVRYPTLYMLDGQNVFDARTSVSGEWEADESATRLIRRGTVEPVVIVAVANAGTRRLEEYTPFRDPAYMPSGGGGEAHLRAIVEELVPLIRQRFRVFSEPSQTALCGSSLGGLMAVYAAYTYPQVFGRIASLSPALWWKNEALVHFVAQRPKPPIDLLYLDMGSGEAGGLPALHRLRLALEDRGFRRERDLFVEEAMGSGHHVSAWATRFPDILERLLPRRR